MDETERQGRIELAAAFRWAHRLGFHEAIANHFSLALDGTDRILINPFGRHFSRMRASDLLLADGEGRVLEGRGELDRTAWCIHSRLHARAPQARCVLHTHMLYATALGCVKGWRMQPIDQNAMRFFERLAHDEDYPGMALDESEGDRLAAALGNRSAMIMGHHGALVVGASVAEAFDDLYYLERACHTQWLALGTGLPLAPVPDEVARKTCEQWHRDYGHFAAAHFASLKSILDEEEPDYCD
jgi:ribulose-5-phosphate 4-epimerase/fuculose-1-phosphate aldolase